MAALPHQGAAMSTPAPKPSTYDDLLRLPPNMVGQIVHGVLHGHPRPAAAHLLAASTMGGEVGSRFMRGRGGPASWWALDQPELHLLGHVLVPDLAGWRRERMPEVPDVAWFELAPDWVCEVLSPSTARLDRIEKLPIYAQAGVGFVWLVDPGARTLEVYRRDGAHWLLVGSHADDARVRAVPFDAIELELDALWLKPAAGDPAAL
jgi:Uma2 family endonuclease